MEELQGDDDDGGRGCVRNLLYRSVELRICPGQVHTPYVRTTITVLSRWRGPGSNVVRLRVENPVADNSEQEHTQHERSAPSSHREKTTTQAKMVDAYRSFATTSAFHLRNTA